MGTSVGFASDRTEPTGRELDCCASSLLIDVFPASSNGRLLTEPFSIGDFDKLMESPFVKKNLALLPSMESCEIGMGLTLVRWI